MFYEDEVHEGDPMRLATRTIVLSIAAATSTTLVACTSSGGTSDAANSPNPPASTSDAPSTPAGTAGPTGSASGSRDHRRPHKQGRHSPSAPTSVPVVVPTGTKAPYPTPGKQPPLQANQSSVLNALPGNSSHSCGKVGNHTALRAGSMAAGDFQSAQHDFRAGYGKSESVQLNMYVIPQHARHLHKVRATIQPVGGGQARRVTSTSVEQADTSRYFAVQIPLSRPGTYKFTFVTGQDRGCFLASFQA
jgi:hypothetical protein